MQNRNACPLFTKLTNSFLLPMVVLSFLSFVFSICCGTKPAPTLPALLLRPLQEEEGNKLRGTGKLMSVTPSSGVTIGHIRWTPHEQSPQAHRTYSIALLDFTYEV